MSESLIPSGSTTDHEINLGSIVIPENPRLEVRLEQDNLISVYIEYGKSSCDAYPEYHYAGALVMLSTITKRNLVLKLAQDDVYPNVWAFLLGRSTISRKSAAVKKCEQVLNKVCQGLALPQSYSPEGLIEELSERPHGYLIKDEAGAMLAAMQKNYMFEMRDLYCVLYDNQSYKRKLRSGQRKERREFNIRDPFVNILTATTPQTFREYTQRIDLTSGWLLRFLYFYPNHKKDWMAFRPAGDEDFERYGAVIGRMMKLRKMFFDRHEPLEIKLSQEAWNYYQTWQRQREGELQGEQDDILLAFWGRLSFYALKLAMLFTIGRADYSEGTEVSLEHIREACRQVDEYFLPISRLIAEEVAREETKNLQNRIISLLKNYGGKMKQRDLLMRLHVPLREYEDAISALIVSEEVIRAKDGKSIWVVLTQHERSVVNDSSVEVMQVFQEFPNNGTINATLETHATDATDATLETEDFNHPLVCHRIKAALARGINDPVELARVCGVPVCVMLKYAAREPRIDQQTVELIYEFAPGLRHASVDGSSDPSSSLAARSDVTGGEVSQHGTYTGEIDHGLQNRDASTSSSEHKHNSAAKFIHRSNETAATDSDAALANLSEPLRILYKLLSELKLATASELARRSGSRLEDVRKALRQLEELGLVRNLGPAEAEPFGPDRWTVNEAQQN